MQIEGFWYYLFLGVFEAATIHYAVAKIFDPLLFGRGWCGYACWTAMVLDFLPYQQPQKPRKENWASSATSARRPAPQRRCVNGRCRTHHAISVKGTGGLKAKSEPSRSRFILFAAAYSADLLLFPFSLSCSDPILCQRRFCNCADQKSLKYCAAITEKCYRISFGAFWRQGASTLNREY